MKMKTVPEGTHTYSFIRKRRACLQASSFFHPLRAGTPLEGRKCKFESYLDCRRQITQVPFILVKGSNISVLTE